MKRILYFKKYMRIATKLYELSMSASRFSFKSIARESITRKLQLRFENWNYFNITSKKMMKKEVLCDFFSFRSFMMFHSLNIKFFSSSFKRFNCLSKRCNFVFASRTSFRTRNRSLCIFRMMKGGMTRSQAFLNATHVKHFLNASFNKHCLIVKK